ncbi:hypothetical protein CBM2633_B10702 [Cupriavidus taiwanensis]|nr:hypothetical protein CBM2633_B10702 [Cupriavidus taiwanensis]
MAVNHYLHIRNVQLIYYEARHHRARLIDTGDNHGHVCRRPQAGGRYRGPAGTIADDRLPAFAVRHHRHGVVF